MESSRRRPTLSDFREEIYLECVVIRNRYQRESHRDRNALVLYRSLRERAGELLYRNRRICSATDSPHLYEVLAYLRDPARAAKLDSFSDHLLALEPQMSGVLQLLVAGTSLLAQQEKPAVQFACGVAIIKLNFELVFPRLREIAEAWGIEDGRNYVTSYTNKEEGHLHALLLAADSEWSPDGCHPRSGKSPHVDMLKEAYRLLLGWHPPVL